MTSTTTADATADDRAVPFRGPQPVGMAMFTKLEAARRQHAGPGLGLEAIEALVR